MRQVGAHQNFHYSVVEVMLTEGLKEVDSKLTNKDICSDGISLVKKSMMMSDN